MITRILCAFLPFILIGCHEAIDDDAQQNSATVLNAVPDAFNLLSIDAISGNAKQFTFSWQASTNANSYTLCLKDEAFSEQCQPLATGLTTTTVTLSLTHLLDSNHLYFVEATNSDGSAKSNELSPAKDALLTAIGLLKATNGQSDDNFGSALALSGDGLTLVVGAPGESSGGSGVNADPNSNRVGKSGAVYVFQRQSQWTQAAYLKASNPNSGDEFGYAVALSGNGQTLAVSALQEASNATGINGDQTDNSFALSGAVYIFTRQGSHWQQQAYLKSSNNSAFDSFGFSLSLSQDGSRLLVGAPGEGSSAQGIDGLQSDDSAPLSGAAYLFVRQGTQWQQAHYIKASNSDTQDNFGYSVALSADGTTLAISASGEGSNAQGTSGTGQADNSANNSGAVYLFSDNGAGLTQSAYLKASNAEALDEFGSSVALNQNGSVLVVGAFNEASTAQTNGNEADNSAPLAGAGYVFVHSAGQWQQQAYLKGFNADSGDKFGDVVRINATGDVIAIGALQESSASAGLDGNEQLNDANASGAVYLYKREQNAWVQSAYLKAKNPDVDDNFGQAVALDSAGDYLSVGAPRESSSAQSNVLSDNSASKSGAVYLY